jgi:hypothetical protein
MPFTLIDERKSLKIYLQQSDINASTLLAITFISAS